MAKYYYNGVLLPEIPADVLTKYPYCYIKLRGDGVTCDLLCGAYTWYVSANRIYIELSWYVWYEATTSSEVWTYENAYIDNGNFGIGDGFVLWSNHDIPNGSATSTEIYLKGSEPVPESGEVEPEDILYSIHGSTLTAIAEEVRRITGTTNKMTTAQIITALQGINTSLQSKTVTPTDVPQTVTADSGYYGLSSVTVEAISEENEHVKEIINEKMEVVANDTY